MSTRIAIATAAAFPDLDEDGPALLAALADRGFDAEPAVWTDDDVEWGAYAAVVVRATWDYAPRRADFLAWARRVEQTALLLNPAAVLEWNTDKTYLRDLEAAGLPVVATQWLTPGDPVALPEAGEYVVKPAVSAGSKDTNRYVAGTHDELARAHAARLLEAGRTVMVQPYLDAVDTAGETALLYTAGAYSHAIRKGPLLTPAMDEVVDLFKQEAIEPREPSTEEHDVAEAVLDALSGLAPAPRGELAYARVDLVPGPDGAPTLLELELAEPSLFLVHDGTGGARSAAGLADAVAGALARASA